MNAPQIVAAGALIAATLGAVRAEERKPDNARLIVGTWEVVKAADGHLRPGDTVELTGEGRVKITTSEKGEKATLGGTYEVKGDALVLTLKLEAESKETLKIGKLSETELVLTAAGGKPVELKRKK